MLQLRLISKWLIFMLPLWVFGFFPTLWEKGTIELWVNARHTIFMDVFFKYATYLGDGFMLIPLGLFLLWWRFRDALMFGMVFLIKAIITHISKEILFHNAPRPREYFRDLEGLYFVPGVEVYAKNSFPSGHTTSAFAMATFFIIWLHLNFPTWSERYKFFIHVGLLVVALVVGFSRIYLFQHFFVDVYAGSILGVVCGILGIYATSYFKPFQNNYLDNGLRHLSKPSDWPYLVYVILVGLVAAALFLPGLDQVHLFDWDEINFAESAREMLVTGDFWRVQINFQPFWEKPPLFFWLQALCMHLGGINEYMARLPNAITGIFWAVFAFFAGKSYKDNITGVVLATLFIGSYLPHFYFKSGIIDPVFNFFIVSSLYTFHQAIRNKDSNYALLCLGGVVNGLAVITKGPVAWLVTFLTLGLFLILLKSTKIKIVLAILVFALVSIACGLFWFVAETLIHGDWYVREFIAYHLRLLTTEDSGHGQPLFYHPLVLLLGMFPASFMALSYLLPSKYKEDSYGLLLNLLFWVVLVLFSLVKTKIVHYSSLCYFPIAYAAMRRVDDACSDRNTISTLLRWSILLYVLFLIVVLTLFPVVMQYKDTWVSMIADTFAQANIRYAVEWPAWLGLPLLALFPVYFWAFRKTLALWLAVLMAGNIFILQYVLYAYIPKIESHVQGAAIEMYKHCANKNAYIYALGYKSYAQYFYGQKKPSERPESSEEAWLAHGPIDKDVYFVSKTNKTMYDTWQQLELLSDTGGYKLYVRKMSQAQ